MAFVDRKPFGHPSHCNLTGDQRAKLDKLYDVVFCHKTGNTESAMHIPGIIDIGIRSDLHEFTFGSPMPWASMTKHDKNIMNRPPQGSEYTQMESLFGCNTLAT
jgi:hypothetical protein